MGVSNNNGLPEEFDFDLFPEVGTEIVVKIKNEYAGTSNGVYRDCKFRVISSDINEGTVNLLPVENIFANRTHIACTNHYWSFCFNIGQFQYKDDKIEEINHSRIPMIDDIEEAEANHIGITNIGFEYWLYDTVAEDKAYYVDNYGDINAKSIFEKIPAIPLITIDVNQFEIIKSSIKTEETMMEFKCVSKSAFLINDDIIYLCLLSLPNDKRTLIATFKNNSSRMNIGDIIVFNLSTISPLKGYKPNHNFESQTFFFRYTSHMRYATAAIFNYNISRQLHIKYLNKTKTVECNNVTQGKKIALDIMSN